MAPEELVIVFVCRLCGKTEAVVPWSHLLLDEVCSRPHVMKKSARST